MLNPAEINARAHGWCLSERDDGYLEIQKNDEDDIFPNDHAALDYVRKLASKGDEAAQAALQLDGTKY
jgi:hypothetical protein